MDWISLQSVPSSTYATSKDEGILQLDDASETTAVPLNPHFIARTELQIQAEGKACLGLPLPPRQLEIPIFSPTTGRPVYLSIRPRRRFGNCRLIHAEDESETAVARTTYRFGPGRYPSIRIGRDDDLEAEEFFMVGKSLLTRTILFETTKWGRFEWRYGNKHERAQYDADNLLILEKIRDQGERLRVAQLVRNEILRAPGTKWASAGNGGRLQMDLVDSDGHEEIEEVVVVMTCLVMLKKEIDRLRMIQMSAMSGGGGG